MATAIFAHPPLKKTGKWSQYVENVLQIENDIFMYFKMR